MMKTGATKVGLPKPGLQERTRQGSLSHTSSSTISSAMKTSRSSNTLASDQRLSRVSHSRVSQHNEKFYDDQMMWNTSTLMSAELTAGVWFSVSWNEPTATMRWRSPCWALLPPAPAWKRLWPLEPSQTLLRAALVLCLVGDLHPELHSHSSVTNWRLEHESGDYLKLELLFTSEWDHSNERYPTIFWPLEGHTAALMLLAVAASSCFCLLTHHWSCLKPFWLLKEALLRWELGLPKWDTICFHSPQTANLWPEKQFSDVTVLSYKGRDERFLSCFWSSLFVITTLLCHLCVLGCKIGDFSFEYNYTGIWHWH